mmetsp:Transcript_6668/g.19297  ORF Transcript_6668/g.19297 Transcript_6668/m.19297 type:complete len:232 (+) Transcript_6668:92-787(+)
MASCAPPAAMATHLRRYMKEETALGAPGARLHHLLAVRQVELLLACHRALAELLRPPVHLRLQRRHQHPQLLQLLCAGGGDRPRRLRQQRGRRQGRRGRRLRADRPREVGGRDAAGDEGGGGGAGGEGGEGGGNGGAAGGVLCSSAARGWPRRSEVSEPSNAWYSPAAASDPAPVARSRISAARQDLAGGGGEVGSPRPRREPTGLSPSNAAASARLSQCCCTATVSASGA